ncbi:MAG: BRO family protein [Rhizonema sp. PD38]|nr:BRO family protein [Rhizonema sp. PD38]
MDIIPQTESPFDQIKNIDDQGNEYWLARQLQSVLGYKQWRRFEETIEKAQAACINTLGDVDDHFLPLVAKSTGGRPSNDYKLSRHACYLTAMNGDPRKTEIAVAQTYFAVKTREAELAREAIRTESSFPGASPQMFATIAQLRNQVQTLEAKVASLMSSQERISELEQAIRLLNLHDSTTPPGWDKKTWEELPPQDKQHFRYLWRRRRFMPSNQGEIKALSPQKSIYEMKRLQHQEMVEVMGEISVEEKQRLDAIKEDMLNRFWA